MQFAVVQSNLTAALKRVEPAVSKASTLPILSFVRLEAKGKHLKLMASNLKVTILTRCEAAVEQEGEGCVPFRLLAEFVNSLPDGRVDLAWRADTKALNLRSGRFESNIKGQDGKDFPAQPSASGDRADIAAKEFSLLVKQVAFAAAKDESRPTLQGAQVILDGGRVTLMAADGFRMSIASGKLNGSVEGKRTTLVPSDALRDFARIVGENGQVEIVTSAKQNHIAFKHADTQMFVQLLEGNFPDLPSLLPRQRNTRAIVKAADFQRAVKLAKFFARDAANIVRFDIHAGSELAPGRLVISAVSAELGDQVGEVDALVEGPAAQIAFNAAFVSEWLEVVGANGAQAALELEDGVKPCVFKVPGDEHFTHVIMPMHVKA